MNTSDGPEVRWRRLALYGLILAVLLSWGWFDVARRARLDPERVRRHRTDLTVFTTAGAAFFDGRDPYSVKSPRGWQYNYPPLFAILIRPLGLLPSGVDGFVWFCINLMLAAGCVVESRRLVLLLAGELPEHVLRLSSIAAAAAVALPALNALQRGQLGILLLYPLLLGLRVSLQGQRFSAALGGGVLLALSAVLKLFPTLPALFLAIVWSLTSRTSRTRRATAGLWAGGAMGALLFLLLIPAMFVGWDQNLAHLKRWTRGVVLNPSLAEETGFNMQSRRNQSLGNAAHLLVSRLDGRSAGDELEQAAPGAYPELDEVPMIAGMGAWTLTMHAVRVGLIVLLVLAGLALARHGDALGLAAGFGLACLLTLMLSPVSWVHYYVIQLPALLLVPLWLFREGWRRAALWAAAVPPVLSVLHYVALDVLGRWGMLGLGTATWFIWICCLALLVRSRQDTTAASHPAPLPAA